MKTFAAVVAAGMFLVLAGCEASSCTTCAKTPAKPAVASCSSCLFTPIVPAVITAETPVPASIDGDYVPVVVVSSAAADEDAAAN